MAFSRGYRNINATYENSTTLASTKHKSCEWYTVTLTLPPADRRRHPIKVVTAMTSVSPQLWEKKIVNCAEERLHVFVSVIKIAAIYDDDIPKRNDGSAPVIMHFLSANKAIHTTRQRKTLKHSEISMNDRIMQKKTMNCMQRRSDWKKKEWSSLCGRWTAIFC